MLRQPENWRSFRIPSGFPRGFRARVYRFPKYSYILPTAAKFTRDTSAKYNAYEFLMCIRPFAHDHTPYPRITTIYTRVQLIVRGTIEMFDVASVIPMKSRQNLSGFISVRICWHHEKYSSTSISFSLFTYSLHGLSLQIRLMRWKYLVEKSFWSIYRDLYIHCSRLKSHIKHRQKDIFSKRILKSITNSVFKSYQTFFSYINISASSDIISKLIIANSPKRFKLWDHARNWRKR